MALNDGCRAPRGGKTADGAAEGAASPPGPNKLIRRRVVSLLMGRGYKPGWCPAHRCIQLQAALSSSTGTVSLQQPFNTMTTIYYISNGQ